MWRTPDQIAAEFIAEGRRQEIAPRGIVICIATGLVETSTLVVYANAKVPGSLALPHDAVGDDELSVGPLQQQVRRGANGQWWWGPVEVCQDPTGSARLFFQRLADLPYEAAVTDEAAGRIAQQVQKSAYPTRYAGRMAEAQRIYDRLAPSAGQNGGTTMPNAPAFRELDFMTGGGRSNRSRQPVNFLLHTEEGNSTAEQLARYCDGSHDVSYHYTVRDGIVCDVVDTDYASWSVLDANSYTINLCFAGSRASWGRGDWLARENDLRIAAYLAVQDARKYKFATDVNPGPRYPRGAAAGISDHRWVTKVKGIGTHTDVGDGFPWDRFEQFVAEYASGVTPAPARNLIDEAAKAAEAWIGKRITQGEGETRPPGSGKFAAFENGTAYWKTGAAAAYVVPRGGLLEAFAALDYEAGPLGFPVLGHTVVDDGGVQAFEGGVLLRKNGSERGFFVHGAIGKRYGAAGWEAGPWGWPTSNETDGPDGTKVQTFENVTATWSPDGVVLAQKEK
ncbi:N-acetylmuramoyl-L-alanine amidase [Tsukamurella sp. 1534]|uniref:N-acetylmuramoyl-L-alanine amidase n=1 Tax=Tsukamurella sp. 1534 TaxID=1151061 RepID=UPI0002E94BA5|nr:N-acetylmuramoyl-L-alanine amidase [Tsukamurella sp. 1534]